MSGELALILPALVVSPTDLKRVEHELTLLDEYLEAQAKREPGLPTPRLPKVSRLLEELAQLNKLNLLHATVRRELSTALRALIEHAPVVTISFATEPSAAALNKMVVWLRQNIQPNILVRVGLQPTIVAGCTLRTTNRYFDFSLRRHLFAQRQLLVDALGSGADNTAAGIAHE